MPKINVIAGVDEVGRGCLAGPVFAAAVILKKNIDTEGIKDSKMISFNKRILMSEYIKKNSFYAVGSASVEEINKINILNASLLSMKRALNKLKLKPSIAYVDGLFIPEGLKIKCKNFIDGDKKIISISAASIIAKDKKIRSIVHKFQQKCAYSPPMKYAGSVLDGRDIITVQVKDANFKFFITASLKERAKRRYRELKNINKKITFNKVLKSLENRDKSDRKRKYGPLKKTKDSILINTTKLSKKACFRKINAIMDSKLNI